MGLPKWRRMRRGSEFRRVLKHGRRARDGRISITAVAADKTATPLQGQNEPETRYGFAVSKRVGNAVVRNRVKRRLRSIARALDAPKGWDVLISAYPSAAEADSRQLEISATRLAARLKVIPPPRAAHRQRRHLSKDK